MGIVFTPVYIKQLGIEAFGLIGFFVVLQAWLSILDIGMTPTLNREVARYRTGAHHPQFILDLVRTFEILCAGLALITSSVLYLTSDWITAHWLNSTTIPAEAVSKSMTLIGLVISLRLFEGLYRGGLLGFEKHGWLNIALATLATFRGLGAVVVLAWLSPTIHAFFLWQVFISFATVLIFSWALRRNLPSTKTRASYSSQSLRVVWKFSSGIFVTSILALLLTNTDKLLLSKLLSLEEFGVYTFSFVVAGVLSIFIGPISQSYYPRLTGLAARGDERAVATAYHQGSQLMTIMLVPAGLLLVAFSHTIVLIWTGNLFLAESASGIVSVITLGTILNGLMHIPYMLQLANGWPTLAARANFAAVLALVPAIIFVVPIYGALGAAWIWCALNAVYILVSIPLMHVRLLRGHAIDWYIRDTLYPSGIAALAIIVSKQLQPQELSELGRVIWILGTGTVAFLGAAWSSSHFRKYLRAIYSRRFY